MYLHFEPKVTTFDLRNATAGKVKRPLSLLHQQFIVIKKRRRFLTKIKTLSKMLLYSSGNSKLKSMSETEILDGGSAPAKRPVFITVLCILTFIGSGWGIISALARTEPSLNAYAPYYKWVELLFCVGTLVGALLMWRLKKTGLYLWTICELGSVVMLWVVIKGYLGMVTSPSSDMTSNMSAEMSDAVNTLNNAGSDMVQSALNMGLMIYTIFPVAFIIMYWVNAKKLH